MKILPLTCISKSFALEDENTTYVLVYFPQYIRISKTCITFCKNMVISSFNSHYILEHWEILYGLLAVHVV
eukprot:c19570_g1_i1 orf=445-657(+)